MQKRISLIIFIGLLMPLAAVAEVTVETGPTFIPRGDAQGARDITVSNGLFAVSFAVDTVPPWGVAQGGIVDVAVWRDGKIGYDIASLADFMPNYWEPWVTTYQTVQIDKATSDEVIIRTLRDFADVELETTFRIKSNDAKIHINTKMTNRGDVKLEELHSGYVVWSDGGSLVGAPGLDSLLRSVSDEAVLPWSASYDEKWLLGLHTPFATFAAYGGRDRYMQHDLDPGESRSFDGWLQIESDGSLAPMVETEIELYGLESGRIYGSVTTLDDGPVDRPALIASQDEQSYAWSLGEDGNYSFVLPVGRYKIYATSKEHSPGKPKSIVIESGSEARIDFSDVEPPGALQISVSDATSGNALDARIDIVSGPIPPIGYFGRSALFTELSSIGSISSDVATGDYELEISAGGGFISLPQRVKINVAPGKATKLDLKVETTAVPQDRQWFSADLHHHSDVLDGFTDAEYVMRSELASGVDITFLSDHDSIFNNAKMQELSAARDVLFIPGTELSASWAHFNAFPLDEGKQFEIDTRRATVQEIFAAARKMGADIIEVNHPYIAYGYFRSHEVGEVPGEYDDGFDLVEIEASIHGGYAERNQKAIDKVWRLWNQGKRVYLAAGSDSHDVWQQPSGAARSFVHVAGELTIDKFVASLKTGRSFASQGPLIYPQIMFGSDVTHPAGDVLELNYTAHAVSGLKSVQLIASGFEVETLLFEGQRIETPVSFSVTPDSDRWYSVVIEDSNGQFAYANPIWITVSE